MRIVHKKLETSQRGVCLQQGMLVCVTGGNGFLASHIVDQLLERGHRVRATVRNSKDESKVGFLRALAERRKCADRLQLYDADLSKKGSFDAAFNGVDVVMHVAAPVVMTAKDPQRDIVDPALLGVDNVVSAVEKNVATIKRVIYTSSTECIGTTAQALRDPHRLFTENDWNVDVDLSNAYTMAKVEAERKITDLFSTRESLKGTQFICLLPAWIAGPLLNLEARPISLEVFLAMSSGEYPFAPRFFLQVVDVRDCASVHVTAAVGKVSHLARTERISVTSSTVMSVGDLCRRLQPMFPMYTFPAFTLPDIFLYIASLWDSRLSRGFLRDNLGVRVCVDNSKSLRLLDANYRSDLETLRDAMQSLIDANMIERKMSRVTILLVILFAFVLLSLVALKIQ